MFDDWLQIRFSQKQTLRQIVQCKQFIWEVITGIASREMRRRERSYDRLCYQANCQDGYLELSWETGRQCRTQVRVIPSTGRKPGCLSTNCLTITFDGCLWGTNSQAFLPFLPHSHADQTYFLKPEKSPGAESCSYSIEMTVQKAWVQRGILLLFLR